jgi:hypothetical protein
MSVEEIYALSFIDHWFLDQIEEIIAAEAKSPPVASTRWTLHAAQAEARRLLRRAPGAADRHQRSRHPRAASCAQGAPGLQARGHLRR